MNTVFRSLLLVVGFLITLAAPTPVLAQADVVVATVNGVDILRSEVESAKQRLPQQLQGMPLESLYGLLVNSLIDSKLVAAAARVEGLHKDARIKKQMLRIEDQILERTFMTDYINARLDDKVLKERYAKLLESASAKTEMRARHILLKEEQQAKDVIAELQAGGDFAELAKKHSTGPSAPNGGDLGFFEPKQMVPEFSKAAQALEIGAFSDVPVKTQFGWHIIKLEKKRDAKPPTYAEAEQDLRMALSSDIATEYLKGLHEGADVKRFNLDGSPMPESN